MKLRKKNEILRKVQFLGSIRRRLVGVNAVGLKVSVKFDEFK